MCFNDTFNGTRKYTAFRKQHSAGSEESSMINLGGPSLACGSSFRIMAMSSLYPGDGLLCSPDVQKVVKEAEGGGLGGAPYRMVWGVGKGLTEYKL